MAEGSPELRLNERDIQRSTPDALPREGTAVVDKKAAWDRKREEIDQIGDRQGVGIDEGIKDTVVVTNLLGVTTINSCEGHMDHGPIIPNIGFAAPEQPKWQYQDQEVVLKRVADKEGVTVDELMHVEKNGAWDKSIADAYAQALKECETHDETLEYIAWREKTNKLKQKVESYLTEFYLKRNRDDSTMLLIHLLEDGKYALLAGPDEEFLAHQNGIELQYEEGEKQELLEARQAEMEAFTEFLKGKYFGEEQESSEEVVDGNEQEEDK